MPSGSGGRGRGKDEEEQWTHRKGDAAPLSLPKTLARDVAATTTAVARISQAALAIKNIFNNQLTDDGGMPSGCGG